VPRSRSDANQRTIVADLRKIGCTVVNLTQVGAGCPDLLVGYRGKTMLLECKNADGRNRIEFSQRDFYKKWQGGPIVIVHNSDAAIRYVSKDGG